MMGSQKKIHDNIGMGSCIVDSAISQPDIAKDAATLCMTCGLCCDGTLFSYTPVDIDDQKDHVTEDADNDDKMSQPCTYYSCELGCQIYTTRPNVCRKFKCQLLRKLLENETTLDDATAIVKMTKKQRSKVIEAIDAKVAFLEPTPLTTKFVQVYSDNGNLSALYKKENVELYLAYMGLVHLIKKYFYPNFQKERTEGVNDGDLEKDP